MLQLQTHLVFESIWYIYIYIYIYKCLGYIIYMLRLENPQIKLILLTTIQQGYNYTSKTTTTTSRLT
jgi:hypothetical protein